MERDLQIDWDLIVQEAIRRRNEQKLTQSELALIAQVSKPTLIKFERQAGNVTIESVFAILRVLGLMKAEHLTFHKIKGK